MMVNFGSHCKGSNQNRSFQWTCPLWSWYNFSFAKIAEIINHNLDFKPIIFTDFLFVFVIGQLRKLWKKLTTNIWWGGGYPNLSGSTNKKKMCLSLRSTSSGGGAAKKFKIKKNAYNVQKQKNIYASIFPLEPKFVSFKIIHFRLFLFQKHIYLYI